jgi:hypothetical protein
MRLNAVPLQPARGDSNPLARLDADGTLVARRVTPEGDTTPWN